MNQEQTLLKIITIAVVISLLVTGILVAFSPKLEQWKKERRKKNRKR
jgi:uncharacterized iron-regulated membrane protein